MFVTLSRRHAGQGSGIHVVRNKRGFRIAVRNDGRKVVNRVFLDFQSGLISFGALQRTVVEYTISN